MWTEGDATRSECLPTGHWAIMRVIKQLPGDKYHWWDLWEALQDDPRQEKPFFTWGRGKARKRLIWQDNDYPGPRCRQRAGIKSKALFTVKTGEENMCFKDQDNPWSVTTSDYTTRNRRHIKSSSFQQQCCSSQWLISSSRNIAALKFRFLISITIQCWIVQVACCYNSRVRVGGGKNRLLRKKKEMSFLNCLFLK